MSLLNPAQLLCCLLKMQGAWEVTPCWMASDVLRLNQIVITKSPLALLLPSAPCQPQWPFQAFIRPVGLFLSCPEGKGGREEDGKVGSESWDVMPSTAAFAAPSFQPASTAPC